MWATTILLNPPSLWITINPDDLHDPVAQVFAGEKIDMNNFIRMAGPDKKRRSQNIAQDPYSAANFFHFLIKMILRTLFGIKVAGCHIERKKGIFGLVNAYFGVVESQGRGTLHLYLLMWLVDAPSTDDIKCLLKSQFFWQWVIEYTHTVFRAHINGLESMDAMNALPTDPEVVYSWPPNPTDKDYWKKYEQMKKEVVRTKQVHTC
jgi:hypothetical protein